MKKVKFICLIGLLSIFSNNGYSQADSLGNKKVRLSEFYLGLGAGPCNKGLGCGLGGTIILSDNWGGSVYFRANFLEAKNLPEDYVDFVLFLPFMSNGIPTDIVQVLSFNLLKEFPTHSKLIRFGIELGPSWTNVQIAHFTPKDYVPGLGSNYNIIREGKNSIGLSLKVKAEFPFSGFAGLELAAYTNINKYQSVIGLDLCVTLGLVR